MTSTGVADDFNKTSTRPPHTPVTAAEIRVIETFITAAETHIIGIEVCAIKTPIAATDAEPDA